MKVRFYLLDGATNASSRHRVLQYLPYLRQHGVQPVVSRPVPEAVYQRLVESGGQTSRRGRGGALSQRELLRVDSPRESPPAALRTTGVRVSGSGLNPSSLPLWERAGVKAAKPTFYALFLATRLLDVLRANPADVVVIQRDLFPFGPPLLERLLARRSAHLVYDTDDATYLRPAFTPDTPFQRLRRFGKVAEVVSRARWVSVATAPIATWARQYNRNVSVVPMAVDLAEYDRVRSALRSDRVVLGWAGTAGGLRYLEALAPVLREVAQRTSIVVRVISGGYRAVCLPGVPVEAHPWRVETALADMKAFDIGLVPLDDSPFEQAKFPFKLLQYLALGVPAVSARVGVACDVIEPGRNGLLAGSPEEWRAGLEALVADAEMRARLASAGRATVAEHYTIDRVAPLVLDGLSLAAR